MDHKFFIELVERIWIIKYKSLLWIFQMQGILKLKYIFPYFLSHSQNYFFPFKYRKISPLLYNVFLFFDRLKNYYARGWGSNEKYILSNADILMIFAKNPKARRVQSGILPAAFVRLYEFKILHYINPCLWWFRTHNKAE